eukprot:m.5212 g.5212  ORF g.5212 m.5212 type:complete len:73 (+) comp3519_c0_seq1:432-650(+)
MAAVQVCVLRCRLKSSYPFSWGQLVTWLESEFVRRVLRVQHRVSGLDAAFSEETWLFRLFLLSKDNSTLSRP